MFGIEYPDPDKVEQEKKKQQALERDYEESGKAELTKLQTELADCFLSSWTFAMAGTAVGLAFSYQRKTYLPLGYGLMSGTLADIFSGCYRCQHQWEAVKAKHNSMQPGRPE